MGGLFDFNGDGHTSFDESMVGGAWLGAVAGGIADSEREYNRTHDFTSDFDDGYDGYDGYYSCDGYDPDKEEFVGRVTCGCTLALMVAFVVLFFGLAIAGSCDSEDVSRPAGSSYGQATSTPTEHDGGIAGQSSPDGAEEPDSYSGNSVGDGGAEGSDAGQVDEERQAQEAAEHEEELQAAAEELADRAPYVGMDVEYIDVTGLGPHDRIDVGVYVGVGRAKKKTTAYRWLARNGTGTVVFSAYVSEYGDIVEVERSGSSTYWPDDREIPDFYAEPQPYVSHGAASDVPPIDPLDYDSPDEYAYDAIDWFSEQGYDDPWDAAYVYWEENGP